jgi:hypothetical protein
MSGSMPYDEYIARVTDLAAAEKLEALVDLVAEHVEAYAPQGLPSTADVLRALPKPTAVRLVRLLLVRTLAMPVPGSPLLGLVSGLFSLLPATLADEDRVLLTEFALRWRILVPIHRYIALVHWQQANGGVSPELMEAAQGMANTSVQLREVLAEIAGPLVYPGDAWADQILADLPGLEPAWRQVVAHAGTAMSAKPSTAWTKRATELLADLDPDQVRTVLGGWLAAATRPPTEIPQYRNADLLRGLLWMIALTPCDPETVRRLGSLTEAMLHRLPGVGPACPKLANAAVGVLARTAGEAALAQLARLSARVTYRGTLNEINKALDAMATAQGVSRDEIEELAVPRYGLTSVGVRTVAFGGCRAEVAVLGTTAVVTWYAESGRRIKSPPAAVRRDHPQALAELKDTVKDLSAMLSAQVDRLDRIFLARRSWPVAAWSERYLDHPVVGVLARRLIWLVDGVACGYADGALRTLADVEVAAPDGATVELWHPIGRPVAETVAWRDWLERHQIVQPFKQAHREVYLLTPAEEATGTYSNRFAGHVLRQHQFHALAAARGWRDRLRVMADTDRPPATRDLPRWGVRAEYWVDGIGDRYDTDTADSGSYLRLTTDQVRFYALEPQGNGRDAEPLPLAQLPPLLFSEVMRDVDLFVGVASVGNDPTWSDGGPEGRFHDYWRSYSFGELSATAQTRRELLLRLLPRLAVGARARVDGRFLVVRGELRTYKIHLGSGNVLMSPNDAYLCIVPDRGAAKRTDGLYLPFEGDTMLAVILSKAMLLAKDNQITDRTITAQLGG